MNPDQYTNLESACQAERTLALGFEPESGRAIDSVPAQLRRYGLREAHSHPLVCGSLGKVDHLYRVQAADAFRRFPHIELSRTPGAFTALVLDIDGREAALTLSDRIVTGAVPPPSWMVTRKESGNLHVTWVLDRPVLRGSNAKIKPQRLLAHIAEYYTHHCGGDRGYTGVITHNPVRSAQRGRYHTTWVRRQPYPLKELAEIVPVGWVPPTIPVSAIGRNTSLFEGLLKWAGRPRNRGCAILPAALAANQKFKYPLPLGDICDMSRRIERYRAQWTYYTSEEASEYGRKGGIRSGETRRRQTAERDERIRAAAAYGLSQRAVARKFRLSLSTVQNVLKRGVTDELHG